MLNVVGKNQGGGWLCCGGEERRKRGEVGERPVWKIFFLLSLLPKVSGVDWYLCDNEISKDEL